MNLLRALLDLVISAFYDPAEEDEPGPTLDEQIQAQRAAELELERIRDKASSFECIGYQPDWGQAINPSRAGADL